MPRWLINALAFVLAVSAIGGSAIYARDREQRRGTDPQKLYRQINKDYFSGALADVPVVWKSLPDAWGETVVLGETPVAIYLDPQINESAADVIDTVRHESCHVFTGRAGDDHGAVFHACMTRFKK
jgi:SprT-like family